MESCVCFHAFGMLEGYCAIFTFFFFTIVEEKIFSQILHDFILSFIFLVSSLNLKENQIYAFMISWIVYSFQRLVFRFPRKSLETHFILHTGWLVSLFILTVVFIIFLLAVSLLLQQCDGHWFSLLPPPLTQMVFLSLPLQCVHILARAQLAMCARELSQLSTELQLMVLILVS